MRRRIPVALSALALAVVALIAPSQAVGPEPAGTAVQTAAKAPQVDPAGVGNAMGWYLQLGDSLAAGYQPDRGEDLTAGYADDALAGLRADAGKTKLRNLACPGETVVTMADGGRCDYPKGSQLDQALQFLHAHGDKTRAITVTIGANDVVSCVLTGTVDEACVQEGMAAVSTRLPQVLTVLREAAPEAQLVVLNYYNPILAFWLNGTDGQQLAEASVPLQAQLNSAIATAAASSDAEVADIAGAFESTELASETLPGVGEVPTNTARICEWTWMCERGDIHANTTGYDVMGRVLARELTD